MDPVHNLVAQLSLSCLDSLPLERSDDVAIRIFESFKPYICKPEQLMAIKRMSSREYYQLEPAGFFTEQEALKISQVIAANLAKNIVADSLTVSRKISNIDWKITACTQELPGVQKVVFLLPKKSLFHDLIGNTKRGRVSLCCAKESEGSAWKSTIVWNLTANPGKAECFVSSRHLEMNLDKIHGPGYFAKPLFDCTYGKSADRRSCYYERLKCLLFWDNQAHGGKLQQVLLSVAQKIAALHKEDTVIVDLKRENTLFAKDFSILFCDIDSIMFKEYERRREHGGTLEYYPPELLEYGFTEGKAGDVFAFGCMILELLLGRDPPWVASGTKRKTDRETLTKYRAAALKARISLEGGVASASKALFYLAQWALHPWRTERPDMATICKHLERKYENGLEGISDDEVKTFLSIEQKAHSDGSIEAVSIQVD